MASAGPQGQLRKESPQSDTAQGRSTLPPRNPGCLGWCLPTWPIRSAPLPWRTGLWKTSTGPASSLPIGGSTTCAGVTACDCGLSDQRHAGCWKLRRFQPGSEVVDQRVCVPLSIECHKQTGYLPFPCPGPCPGSRRTPRPDIAPAVASPILDCLTPDQRSECGYRIWLSASPGED